MLFHWLCPSGFNAKSLSEQRNACVVKWNPLYWACFLVTFLSLWLGREGHLVVGQGGAVSKEERREEYEVRVHWLYTTSGVVRAAARPRGAFLPRARCLPLPFSPKSPPPFNCSGARAAPPRARPTACPQKAPCCGCWCDPCSR